MSSVLILPILTALPALEPVIEAESQDGEGEDTATEVSVEVNQEAVAA